MSAHLENYFRLMTANGAVQIYRAAQRHGIFETLSKEPMSAPTLAQSTGLNEPALHLLLDSLLALGLIEQSDELLQPGGLLQALQGSYRSLGDEYWTHLDAWLTSGEPIRRMNSAAEGEAAYREQAAALAWMMNPAARHAAALLGPTLPPEAVILDVGSGSGVWSIALLAGLPGAIATLVDRAGVLEVARQFAVRAGVESRVRGQPGDYHEIELPEGGHDLAILANVCHLETDAGNRALLARTARWLKPGGRIAIIDVSAEKEPLAATLYAIGLALRTKSVAVPTRDQIAQWLGASGFSNPEFQILEGEPGTMGMWTATRLQSADIFPAMQAAPNESSTEEEAF